jgi:hypothetical protein
MVRAGLAGMPEVDEAAFPRAGLYCDAQLLFPERFTVELLVDARDIAAAAGTRFEVATHREVQFGHDGMLRVGPSAASGPFEVRPDAIINATGAWVDRTLAALFPGDAAASGVLQWRIPSLVLTPRGTLVAFAEGRTDPSTDCAYKFVSSRRSVDGGASWSLPRTASNPSRAGYPSAVALWGDLGVECGGVLPPQPGFAGGPCTAAADCCSGVCTTSGACQ